MIRNLNLFYTDIMRIIEEDKLGRKNSVHESE